MRSKSGTPHFLLGAMLARQNTGGEVGDTVGEKKNRQPLPVQLDRRCLSLAYFYIHWGLCAQAQNPPPQGFSAAPPTRI